MSKPWSLRDYPFESYAGLAAFLASALTLADWHIPWLFSDVQEPSEIVLPMAMFGLLGGLAVFICLVLLKDLKGTAFSIAWLCGTAFASVILSALLDGPIGPVAAATLTSAAIVGCFRVVFLLRVDKAASVIVEG